MVKVLFVCMGNICRSPTAEGVFREYVHRAGLIEEIQIDSAGTHSYHVGSQPDKRAQRAAMKRGVDLSTQRARSVAEQDFEVFDYILAMDGANYEDLVAFCPKDHQHKIHLYLTFAKNSDERDVPDPYYGGSKGFEYVLDLVEEAAEGFIEHLRQQGLQK